MVVNSSDDLPEEEQKRLRRSLWLVLLTMFLTSLGFTIFIPMLWFYYSGFSECSTPDGLEFCNKFQGLIVAAFPLGQFIAAPVLGFWANRRPMREVLIFSLFCTMGGYVTFCHVKTGWQLLLSRLLLGFGGGNTAPLRGYASEVTGMKRRTVVMAQMSAAQSFGFVLGPGVGYMFGLIDGVNIGKLSLTKYTSAGYCAAVITVINLIILLVGFVDVPKALRAFSRDTRGKRMYSSYDARAVWVLISFFSITIVIFAIYEGVGTQITETAFHWHIKENGIFLVCIGILSIAVVLSMKKLSDLMGDRLLMVVATLVLFCSMLFMIDFGWWDGTYLSLWQWILGSIIMAFGYPIAQAMSYVLFSKVIPRDRQSIMMGWLTAGGSAARMVGPPFATWAYTVANYHSYIIFFVACFIMLLALLAVALSWKHLVPHVDYDYTPLENNNDDRGGEISIQEMPSENDIYDEEVAGAAVPPPRLSVGEDLRSSLRGGYRPLVEEQNSVN